MAKLCVASFVLSPCPFVAVLRLYAVCKGHVRKLFGMGEMGASSGEGAQGLRRTYGRASVSWHLPPAHGWETLAEWEPGFPGGVRGDGESVLMASVVSVRTPVPWASSRSLCSTPPGTCRQWRSRRFSPLCLYPGITPAVETPGSG